MWKKKGSMIKCGIMLLVILNRVLEIVSLRRKICAQNGRRLGKETDMQVSSEEHSMCKDKQMKSPGIGEYLA